MPWVYSPHTGGIQIPKAVQDRARERILAHAEPRYGRRWRIEVRFRGALCYVDAFARDGDEFQMRLVRLRFFGGDRWTLAFYTYSHEKYEPSFFPSGEDFGTPEEGFDVGAVYLDE
ncbi:MAG: hypothetical protein HY791_01910 [Deltaproteobacteria bacterium]|nr:hypothetical protein [Deltaproteobacteria bacterium]